jgi:hypothetical protein
MQLLLRTGTQVNLGIVWFVLDLSLGTVVLRSGRWPDQFFVAITVFRLFKILIYFLNFEMVSSCICINWHVRKST